MNRTSISDLKLKAKDQLLGNYGIATGSFALLFVFIYTLIAIVMSAFTYTLRQDLYLGGTMTLAQDIEVSIIGIIIGAISVTFSVGYIQIMRKIALGEQPFISDLFHVFKNHPDKVIIISLILGGAQFILLLPATIVKSQVFGQTMNDFDAKNFLLWVILYLAGFIISFIIDIMLALSFLIYLDDPSESVSHMVKTSVEMMKGNKFRYFYMLLSFIGYWALGVLSCGLAFIWVVPYQTMTTVEFYLDLKGDVYEC